MLMGYFPGSPVDWVFKIVGGGDWTIASCVIDDLIIQYLVHICSANYYADCSIYIHHWHWTAIESHYHCEGESENGKFNVCGIHGLEYVRIWLAIKL